MLSDAPDDSPLVKSRKSTPLLTPRERTSTPGVGKTTPAPVPVATPKEKTPNAVLTPRVKTPSPAPAPVPGTVRPSPVSTPSSVRTLAPVPAPAPAPTSAKPLPRAAPLRRPPSLLPRPPIRVLPSSPAVATPPVRRSPIAIPQTPQQPTPLTRRTPIVIPEKEYISINLDSISSPQGRSVGDEPIVDVTEEELDGLGYGKAKSPVRRSVTPPPPSSRSRSPVVNAARSPIATSAKSPVRSTTPPSSTDTKKPVAADEGIDYEDDEKDLNDDEKWVLLMARIKVMKRGWPELHVPEEEDKAKISLAALSKYYKKLKARVFAEECSGGYKKWLLAAFVALEVLCVRLFGMEAMSGFTMNQIMALNSYQTLLIELAEKYGSSYKSYLPVELRLIFAVGVNGIIFFVMKLLFGEGGGEQSRNIAAALGGNGDNSGMAGMVGNVMNMLTGGGKNAAASTGSETLNGPAPRRRRKE